MSEKTLKFKNIKLNNKEFHKSKQPLDLKSINFDQIVVSDKFKHSDKGFKYFIAYQDNEIVKPLSTILPQMIGYIKYLKNGGKKNMYFFVRGHNVLDKYNEIWYKIKEKLNINFHSKPVYNQKYLKAKVREFDSVIKTNFLGNEVPKENMHYACIACITIDSVMKIEKKNYPQVYLEKCKYRVRKIQMSRFVSARLESDSELDSEAESKSDTELKSNSNSE